MSFRFASLKADKARHIRNIKPQSASETSHLVAGGNRFIAVALERKGCIGLYSIKDLPDSKAKQHVIHAHNAKVGDLQWSPHDSRILMSGGADGKLKLWSIAPEGLSNDCKDHQASLCIELGAINQVQWHPSAANVAAVACKEGLAIVDWTASEVKQVFKLSSRGDGILSVTWSDNGSTLACLTKTSKLFVLDPRQRHASPKLLEATTGAAKEGKDAESGVIVQIDTGMKRPQRCMYVSKKNASTGRIMVLGINAQHRPAVHIFSSEASTLLAEAAPPHAPIAKETLSFSSGNMLSAYDEDSRLLFLCMRGSSQMVMYQVGDEETDAAFTLKQTQGGGYIDTGAEGFTLVHKSACDIHDSEVQRVYVIADRKLQVYRQIVPQRKKGLLESLFPDTRAYRSALSAADYFQGQNRPPVLESVEKLNGALQAVSLSPLLDDAQSVLSTSPQSGLDTKAAVISNAAATTKATPTNESLSTAGAPDIISPLASFQSHSRQRVNSRLAGSKYRHIQCAEPLQKSRCYHDLNNSEQNLLLYKNIHANTLFWATPWKTSGGSALAVFRVGEQADLGRTPLNKQDSGVLRMSSNLASFALSPLQPNLIATATVESIKVWELPTVGLNESNNSSDADREKLCRRTLQPEGKVNNIAFHPYISNLLVCSSNSFSGVHLEFFDVQEQQGRSNGDPLKASTIVDLPFLHSPNSGINQPVCDFDFHPDGGSVLCCSKDGTVSVVDPVNKSVKGPIHSAESKRICQCRWISPTRFLTIGFSGRGTRSISLWEYTNAVDAKAPEKPLFSHMMDTNSSWMIPHVDLERNLLLIINVGGRSAHIFEIEHGSDTLKHISDVSFTSLTTGFCLLPSTCCDVKKVEVFSSLSLSASESVCKPQSWTIPKKRTEFFQDELFPDIASADARLSADEFLTGAELPTPRRVNLCPSDMTPLSEAPAEAITEHEKKYIKRKSLMAQPAKKGFLGHTSAAQVRSHFRNKTKDYEGFKNRWDAHDSDEEGSDSSEGMWDDEE